MMFFQFFDAEIGGPNWPWAATLSAPIVVERKCPTCGSEIGRYDGSGWARIDEGRQWADAIGSGSVGPRFMVSERVVTALRQANYTGFRAYPIAIREATSPPLREVPPPKYFHLCVTGEIDVDLEASGVRSEWMCGVCFAARRRTEPRRLVPLPRTWDGADLFQIRNYPSGMVFCSERVLLLAREHRWTNFRFQPIDIIRRHAVGWGGVDYLGATWPPALWYPDAPSSGKTLDEWVQWTRLDGEQAILDAVRLWGLKGPEEVTPAIVDAVTEGCAARAAEALLDFPEEATTRMIEQLRTGNEIGRRNAAQVLCRLRIKCGIDLSKEVKDLIRKNHREFHESFLE